MMQIREWYANAANMRMDWIRNSLIRMKFVYWHHIV